MIKNLLLAFKQYIRFKPFAYIKSCGWYIKDHKKLKRSPNPAFNTTLFYPCLTDKTENTPLDPIYFYQNAWAAGKIFEVKPASHFDIGSQVGFVGIVSQFVPTTMVDIRPIDVELPGLTFLKGDILKLPIKDNELESVSSICVVEHIGLGRYGDAVDAYGSEKSIIELIRITKPGGKIIISVPIDNGDKIYFNAHRAFTRDHMLRLFAGCTVLEEKYIYGNRFFSNYDEAKGFGTGLFHFEKG
jgi:SAM-dependent methyltransferase